MRHWQKRWRDFLEEWNLWCRGRPRARLLPALLPDVREQPAHVQEAFTLLGRQGGIGSPRWAHELGVEGLRCWPLSSFPYLLFYFEHDDAVDLARLLHGARDIPATMAEPDTA